jgi:hypothetical protein
MKSLYLWFCGVIFGAFLINFVPKDVIRASQKTTTAVFKNLSTFDWNQSKLAELSGSRLNEAEKRTSVAEEAPRAAAVAASAAPEANTNSQEKSMTLGELAEQARFPLSAALVHDLEKAWDSLPQDAEAVIEPNGWRITRLKEGSPLARAGFKEGDLIESEKLDASLAAFTSPEHKLALRIVRILNRITH